MLQKITHQDRNQHVAMSSYIKFQSICRTFDFGTKFAQSYVTKV